MAHWVGILNEPERIVITGKTKQEVIFMLGVKMTDKSRYMAGNIMNQLKAQHDKTAVAYGLEEDEEVAKVFSCNCGSVIKHTVKPE